MALNWKNDYTQHKTTFSLQSFYKKKQARVYSGFAFTIFTIAFFMFFAIKPTLITITQLLKNIDDQRQVSATLQEKITALKQAQEQYNLVSNQIVLLDTALPKNPEIESLVQNVEFLTHNNQLNLTSLKVDEVTLWENGAAISPTSIPLPSVQPATNNQESNSNITNSSPVQNEQTITFSLVASGSYDNLKLFLNDLVNLRRIIRIDSVAFSPSKDNAQILNLNLQAKTYLLK